MPVLRVLQALVKGFHPNTAADSSRQSFKTLLVSRCYFRLKLNAYSLTACGVEWLNAHILKDLGAVTTKADEQLRY